MPQSNYPRGRVLSSPPPEFETKPFTLSEDLLRKATFRNLNYKSLGGICVVVVVTACAMPIIAGTPDNLWFVAGFAFIICLFLIAVVLGMVAVRQRQAMRNKVNAPLFDDLRTVSATSDGIRQKLDCGVESFIPWTIISRISVKSDWVEFWFMTGAYFLVPVNAFTAVEKVTEIKEFARLESLEAKI
jgi:hypothetical protein